MKRIVNVLLGYAIAVVLVSGLAQAGEPIEIFINPSSKFLKEEIALLTKLGASITVSANDVLVAKFPLGVDPDLYRYQNPNEPLGSYFCLHDKYPDCKQNGPQIKVKASEVIKNRPGALVTDYELLNQDEAGAIISGQTEPKNLQSWKGRLPKTEYNDMVAKVKTEEHVANSVAKNVATSSRIVDSTGNAKPVSSKLTSRLPKIAGKIAQGALDPKKAAIDTTLGITQSATGISMKTAAKLAGPALIVSDVVLMIAQGVSYSNCSDAVNDALSAAMTAAMKEISGKDIYALCVRVYGNPEICGKERSKYLCNASESGKDGGEIKKDLIEYLNKVAKAAEEAAAPKGGWATSDIQCFHPIDGPDVSIPPVGIGAPPTMIAPEKFLSNGVQNELEKLKSLNLDSNFCSIDCKAENTSLQLLSDLIQSCELMGKQMSDCRAYQVRSQCVGTTCQGLSLKESAERYKAAEAVCKSKNYSPNDESCILMMNCRPACDSSTKETLDKTWDDRVCGIKPS